MNIESSELELAERNILRGCAVCGSMINAVASHRGSLDLPDLLVSGSGVGRD
jgi:hypothetical protein